MRRLASLVDDEDKRVAIAACQALLDRGFGKPMQSMQMDAEVSGSISNGLSDAELDKQLRLQVLANKSLIESIMKEISK